MTFTGETSQKSNERVRLGVDVGGTFTDVAVSVPGRGIITTKVLTTADNPAVGVMSGILRLLSDNPIERSSVGTIVHGTTLATNAIIERKGASVGLITTRGFRDVLETGTEVRYDLYDLFIEFPRPLVPRRQRIGVRERTRYDGVVVSQVDKTDAMRASDALRHHDVQSVAICFLHSYANGKNERRMAQFLRRLLPDVQISMSCEVLPQVGEYGRVSSTVANAYVQPLVSGYLDQIVNGLEQESLAGPLYVMGSNGGTLSVGAAKRFPVRLVESGPAAGASAASYVARESGLPNVLAFDMGGTTAKICIVDGGTPARTMEFEVARVRRFEKGSGILLKVPSVDLIEIGAGGGSIARIDELGLLAVGPDSAGAKPGPACYGLGGTAPTVTDADVVLGIIGAKSFLGGEMPLDAIRARTAIEHLGDRLSLSVEDAALGIHEVVNENMANAAEIYAAEKGVDLRDYGLLAFGGAAPAHACAVARRLNIRTVVVPSAAGVFSAVGCALAPLTFDFVTGYMRELRDIDWEWLSERLSSMEASGREYLQEALSDGEAFVRRSADMRYLGQRYEVEVDLPDGRLDIDMVDSIAREFRETYRRTYGREVPEVPIEAVQWRVSVSGPIPSVSLKGERPRGAGRQRVEQERRVYGSGGYTDFAVYRREQLSRGRNISGPALIESIESTAVVPADATAELDEFGSLRILLS